MGVKYWYHPAETITFLTEDNEETSTVQICTDGSKLEQGVGAGIVILKSGNLINSLKYRLNKRCTNNQTEQLAILRALEFTENIELADRLAKEAARNSDICYNRIPESEIVHQEREKNKEKWQQQWDNSTKGSVNKNFFRA